MYPEEKVYRSMLYFTTSIIPSGIDVVDGESYGIRMDDPAGSTPSVAVTMGNISDAALELGSAGTSYPIIFTISAQSRMQRDALKDIVRSGLIYNSIPIYSDFSGFTPTIGADIEKYAELGGYYRATNMPNFSSNREAFYWVAVVFVTLDVLGL